MPIGNTESLPLLATFQAILETRNVSAAADKLGLTQSAVSKHLARLRLDYDDPLFVRGTEGMMPTPRAEAMAPRVTVILNQLTMLKTEQSFDPSALTGDVTISATDERRAALLPNLLITLENEAPKLRLNLLPLASDYSADLLQSGAVDLVIAVNWHAPPVLKQSLLSRDSFVCVMGQGHPLAANPLTLSEFADADHVLVAPLGKRLGRVDEILNASGTQRRVALSVPEFHAVTADLLRDRYLVTLPRRVAERLIDASPTDALRMADLPFDLPGFEYFAFWHIRFDRDPRHLWIRETVRRVMNPRSAQGL